MGGDALKMGRILRLNEWAFTRYPNDVIAQVLFLSSLSINDIVIALECSKEEARECFNYLNGVSNET